MITLKCNSCGRKINVGGISQECPFCESKDIVNSPYVQQEIRDLKPGDAQYVEYEEWIRQRTPTYESKKKSGGIMAWVRKLLRIILERRG